MKVKIFAFIIMYAIFYNPVTTSAQDACNNGISQADQDLWADHNCWWDFVLYQFRAYRMFDDKWGNWGFRDACNLNLAYAKAVNASYLLAYGLTDDRNSQWHGIIDYQRAAVAYGTPNHNQMTYEPSTNRGWLAKASSNGITRLGCLLFDANSINGVPSTRSGDFFHSPNQAQVEYLCDIAENAADFVPASVRQLAESEANQRLTSRFINDVAYLCGDPRPW